MKQLFHIDNATSENEQQILSLRLGKKHISFAISNKSGSELYELAYCSIDSCNDNELNDFHSTFLSLQNSFYQIQIVYDFPESILITSKDYKSEDAALLLSTAGCNSATVNIVSELIADWQLYNIYAVPKEIQEWMGRKFPSASFRHQYSLGIKSINAAEKGGSLSVDIRKDDFSMIAAKSSKILLTQTFEYSTPEDILFYLLKTCQQFSLSQREVQLQISGLIDKQSALYKELYQYFICIEFRAANWNVRSDYPAHFFTSLNDLAKCVS